MMKPRLIDFEYGFAWCCLDTKITFSMVLHGPSLEKWLHSAV